MDPNAAPVVDAQDELLEAEEPVLEYDLEKAAAFKASLEAQQNLGLAIVGGLSAALVGAGLWAAITVATHRQSWLMALGVGVFVAWKVRKLGKGISKLFSVVGVICALLGCVLGNLFSACGFVSVQTDEPFVAVLRAVLSQPEVAINLMTATFQPFDVLFYAIAMTIAYKGSSREITAEELASLMKPVDATA